MDLILIKLFSLTHTIIKLNIGGLAWGVGVLWLCSYWKHAFSITHATTTGWRCSKLYICQAFMVCVHTRTNGIIHKPQSRFTK